ncbi:Nlrc3 [Symbiodinium sp. CCMP2592]|nr:Nlrc3 [Symbiodinium sp. CCMP2592]
MQSPARLACPICQEDGITGEHIKLAAASQVASCGHRFCTQCIEQWAASCSSCPLCKQEMGALLPLPHGETGGSAPAKRRLVPARQLELSDEDKKHNITAVDLSDNALDNSGGAKVLEYMLENDLVKRLVLNDNDLGDDIAEALANLLQTNSTLEQLELQGNTIYTEGMACLATSLPKNRVLQHLDLGHNQLGIHGAELLAPGLPGSSLTSLSLSGNRICGSGAQQILLSLKDSGSVAFLDLAMNEIGSQGIELMCSALAENGTVTSLNLGSNRIDADGAVCLCTAISENTALRIVTLQQNELGEQGAASVADMLVKNGRLTCLDLTGNSIGDVGAANIAAAIEKHGSFKSLALAHNSISDEAAASLASAARSSLCSLALAGNAIGDDGGSQLLQAATENAELVVLDLLYNNISSEVSDAIEKLLRDRCAVEVTNLTFFCCAMDAMLGITLFALESLLFHPEIGTARGARASEAQGSAWGGLQGASPSLAAGQLRVVDLVVACAVSQAFACARVIMIPRCFSEESRERIVLAVFVLPCVQPKFSHLDDPVLSQVTKSCACFTSLRGKEGRERIALAVFELPCIWPSRRSTWPACRAFTTHMQRFMLACLHPSGFASLDRLWELERKVSEPQEESVSEEAGARSQANQNETLPRIEGDNYSLASEPERGDAISTVNACLESSFSLKQAVKDEAIDPMEMKAILTRLGRCASQGSTLMKRIFVDQDAPFTFHGQMAGEDKDKKLALRPWGEADEACLPAAERAAGASTPEDAEHLLTEAGHCLSAIGRAIVMTPVRQGGVSAAASGLFHVMRCCRRAHGMPMCCMSIASC